MVEALGAAARKHQTHTRVGTEVLAVDICGGPLPDTHRHGIRDAVARPGPQGIPTRRIALKRIALRAPVTPGALGRGIPAPCPGKEYN